MVGNTKLYLYGVQAGGDFLKMFRYPFISGNANTALADPLSIVLTESTAKALFGNTDAINKVVRVDNRDNLKVTAVIADHLPIQLSGLNISSLSAISRK